MPCEHKDFTAHVGVNRFEDMTPMGFNAEVRIECSECGERFRFVGLQPGLSWREPRVSINATDVYLPIEPEGEPRVLGGPVVFEMPKKLKGES